MEDRRTDNTKLDELHDAVIRLETKVNNGLSHRTKRTEEKLDALHDDHTGMRAILQEHINDEDSKQQEILQLVKCTRRFIIGGVLALITGMGSVITWLVINSDTITKLMNHIASIIGA